MNIACPTPLKPVSKREIVAERRLCGDLFELSTLLIPPHESISLAFSPLINLVMMVSGCVTIAFNDATFELSVGQVWLAGVDEQCKITNDNADRDAVVISVRIQPNMLARFYERYDIDLAQRKTLSGVTESVIPRGQSPIVFPGCDLTRLTLESFRLFIQQFDDGLNALKLEELLLLKLNGEHGQILAEEMRNKTNPMQEKFRRFMEENITNNWSVATYAKQFGMSLTAFKTMFSQVYKEQSPKAWINEKRLRYADVQLRTTNKRLVDIALDSGFSSQSYFTQLYKARYGVSPSEARQQP